MRPTVLNSVVRRLNRPNSGNRSNGIWVIWTSDPELPSDLLLTVSLCQVLHENWNVLIAQAGALCHHRAYEHLPFVFAEMLARDQIQVVAGGARVFQNLLGGRIAVAGLRLLLAGGFSIAEI